MIKRTKKESNRETNTNSGRIYQNRTADKDRFFQGPFVAQIEKCKTNGSLEITWVMHTRNCRSKRYSENFHEFLWCSTEIYFRTATSPNLTFLKLEVLLGRKTKKMIRRGHYSSNNFQDLTKRKSTKKKTLGYLLRVLFFNAFELGAESGNQVFSNEALRSIVYQS
jgi:hypothetical protein